MRRGSDPKSASSRVSEFKALRKQDFGACFRCSAHVSMGPSFAMCVSQNNLHRVPNNDTYNSCGSVRTHGVVWALFEETPIIQRLDSVASAVIPSSGKRLVGLGLFCV